MHHPNIVIYSRVSSEGQVLYGSWLSWQENMCERYANNKGWNIVKIFREKGFTGRHDSRPALDEMSRFVTKHNRTNPDNPIHIILTDELDRMARNQKFYRDFKEKMEGIGIQVKNIKMDFSDNAAWWMAEANAATYAEFFSRQNAERVYNRQMARLLDGYWCWGVPIGYEYKQAKEGGKILVKVEPEATVLAEGMTAYAQGHINSLRDLAEYRAKAGLHCGGRHLSKNYKRMSKGNVSKILNNILYAGYIEVDKCSTTGIKKWERKISLRKAKHEAIIPLSTYQKIQERLTQKSRRTKTQEKMLLNEDFPLKSILSDEWGNPMAAAWSKGRSQRYPYYRFSTLSPFKGKSIRADKIHQWFEEFLGDMKLKKEDQKYLGERIIQLLDEQKGKLANKKEGLENKLQELLQEEEALATKVFSFSSDLLIKKAEERLSEINKEKKATLIALEEEEDSPVFSKELVKQVFRVAFSPKTAWKQANSDQRAELLRLWFKDTLWVSKDQNGFVNPSKHQLTTSIYHHLIPFCTGGGESNIYFEPYPVVDWSYDGSYKTSHWRALYKSLCLSQEKIENIIQEINKWIFFISHNSDLVEKINKSE